MGEESEKGDMQGNKHEVKYETPPSPRNMQGSALGETTQMRLDGPYPNHALMTPSLMVRYTPDSEGPKDLELLAWLTVFDNGTTT